MYLHGQKVKNMVQDCEMSDIEYSWYMVTVYNIYFFKSIWSRICSKNTSIRPTQFYGYYKQLFRSFYSHPTKVFRWRMVFHYVSDGTNECIIPIIINRKRHIIRGISSYGRLDYEDIVTSVNDVEFVRKSIHKVFTKYVGYSLDMNNINEGGILYKALQPILVPQLPCVAINIDKDYDLYIAGLSKHQRQNIRTAYNRLETENYEFQLVQYDKKYPLPRKIWNQCEHIYESRHGYTYTGGKIQLWWDRITNPYHRILVQESSKLTFVLYHHNKVVAYMAGLCTNQTFYVPRLCINMEYYRYSPGIILVNETIRSLITQGIKTLDLMEGDEPYKLAMGGYIHQNYKLNTDVNKIIELCTPQ